MPETGRDLSDERSTPTECSVASLVELKRRGSGSLVSRFEWAFSEVAGPRELGDALPRTRHGCCAKCNRPANGRFRRTIAALDQPELRAAYAAIPRLLPEPCEAPAGADEVKDFRGEAATSDRRTCFFEL